MSLGVFPAIWIPPGLGSAVRYTPVADYNTHMYTIKQDDNMVLCQIVTELEPMLYSSVGFLACYMQITQIIQMQIMQ